MKAAAAQALRARKGRATQYAVLPYRSGRTGEVEILLITSRRTRRWIVPKGWPIDGLEPHASAAREALEEAGIEGETAATAVGSFDYLKQLRGGLSVRCHVSVFALRVTRQRKSWLEKDQRELRWVPYTEAAALVDEPELKRLIARFGADMAPAA